MTMRFISICNNCTIIHSVCCIVLVWKLMNSYARGRIDTLHINTRNRFGV